MRYALTEAVHVLGKFEHGDTVTAEVYALASGAAVALTSNVCSEVGATGVFAFALTNLADAPGGYAEYLVVLSNSTTAAYSKVAVGGYPDASSSDAVWAHASGARLHDLMTGRWKVTGTQMVCYGPDGVTPVRTFNLFDAEGQPTGRNPVERVPV